MLNKGAEKMTAIEAFLYESHLKDIQDEFCRENMCRDMIMDEVDTELDILTSHADQLFHR